MLWNDVIQTGDFVPYGDFSVIAWIDNLPNFMHRSRVYRLGAVIQIGLGRLSSKKRLFSTVALALLMLATWVCISAPTSADRPLGDALDFD